MLSQSDINETPFLTLLHPDISHEYFFENKYSGRVRICFTITGILITRILSFGFS